MSLTRDQLAQYWGCWPHNECYPDCCEAAQWAIDNPDAADPGELRRAETWAAGETWA